MDWFVHPTWGADDDPADRVVSTVHQADPVGFTPPSIFEQFAAASRHHQRQILRELSADDQALLILVARRALPRDIAKVRQMSIPATQEALVRLERRVAQCWVPERVHVVSSAR